MTATITQLHLRKRYRKVIAMQAADPVRFLPSPRGPKHQTRDERYNGILRYLRMRMPETWDHDTAHHIHVEERLASLAEHIDREKQFAAAVAKMFPMTGDERAIWSKLDEAYHWVQKALEIARSGDDPSAVDHIDEAEVVEV